MTATPIPRSLALTQFGDLDVTTVRDLPPGRQPVVTSRVPGAKARQKTWHFIREKLDEGRQLYVICPKVGSADEARSLQEAEESDELSASVEATFKELSDGELKGYEVGLVHGQMDAKKKRGRDGGRFFFLKPGRRRSSSAPPWWRWAWTCRTRR